MVLELSGTLPLSVLSRQASYLKKQDGYEGFLSVGGIYTRPSVKGRYQTKHPFDRRPWIRVPLQPAAVTLCSEIALCGRTCCLCLGLPACVCVYVCERERERSWSCRCAGLTETASVLIPPFISSTRKKYYN